MQRLDLDQDALDFIARQRAYHVREAEGGADDYLPEQDRRNREHVLGPLARVQRDDDVLLNGDVYRVIGPAREEGWLYVLVQSFRGLTDMPMEGRYITDRAPADPLDEPLPIFEEPPIEDEEP